MIQSEFWFQNGELQTLLSNPTPPLNNKLHFSLKLDNVLASGPQNEPQEIVINTSTSTFVTFPIYSFPARLVKREMI